MAANMLSRCQYIVVSQTQLDPSVITRWTCNYIMLFANGKITILALILKVTGRWDTGMLVLLLLLSSN